MININDVIFLYHESEESVYKYLFEKISELYFNLLKNVDINVANQSLMYMRSLVYINYSQYDLECYEIVDLLYDENYDEEKIKNIVEIYNKIQELYIYGKKKRLDTSKEIGKLVSINKCEYASEYVFSMICELINKKFSINSYSVADVLNSIEDNMPYLYEAIFHYINGKFYNDIERFNYIFELYNNMLLEFSENKINLLLNSGKVYESVREYQDLVEEKLKSKKEYEKKNNWYDMIKLFEDKYEEIRDILDVDEETELYYIMKLYDRLKKEG